MAEEHAVAVLTTVFNSLIYYYEVLVLATWTVDNGLCSSVVELNLTKVAGV